MESKKTNPDRTKSSAKRGESAHAAPTFEEQLAGLEFERGQDTEQAGQAIPVEAIPVDQAAHYDPRNVHSASGGPEDAEQPIVAAVPVVAIPVQPAVPVQPLPPSLDSDFGGASGMGMHSDASLNPSGLSAEVPAEVGTEHEVLDSARRRFLLAAIPSWLISLLVHLGLILILAAITFEPIQQTISLLEASMGDAPPAVEEFDLQGPTLESSSDPVSDPLAMPAPTISDVVAVPELQTPQMAIMEPDLSALEMNKVTESIIPSALLNTSTLAQMTTALNSRSAASKSEMLERYGGNASSEKAVALALKWLASHQARDGGWSFDHSAICGKQCDNPGDMDLARNGATAMALLPFLGAGQTHLEGQYKETVYRGLAFLINRLKVTPSATLPYGSWHEPGGRMYSHGLAAITICEAYAMTGDPDLLQPAQLCLNYLVYAQNGEDGGWRYEPGQRGDTSVVGWCLMALKSGKMGSLVVPPRTFVGADRFLNFVSTNDGAFYGYDKPTSNLGRVRATTAVGLLCRMYLGYPQDEPGIQNGIKFLSETGPKLDDLYYSYYATQVLRHNGGAAWEKWNKSMRDQLIKAQVSEGHAAGSWSLDGKWANHGGRLYTTSLATMILEVYYRHMPLYSSKSADDDFEI